MSRRFKSKNPSIEAMVHLPLPDIKILLFPSGFCSLLAWVAAFTQRKDVQGKPQLTMPSFCRRRMCRRPVRRPFLSAQTDPNQNPERIPKAWSRSMHGQATKTTCRRTCGHPRPGKHWKGSWHTGLRRTASAAAQQHPCLLSPSAPQHSRCKLIVRDKKMKPGP